MRITRIALTMAVFGAIEPSRSVRRMPADRPTPDIRHQTDLVCRVAGGTAEGRRNQGKQNVRRNQLRGAACAPLRQHAVGALEDRAARILNLLCCGGSDE